MKKRSLMIWFMVFSVIFYMSHVIFGRLSYPNYDALSQAVSDLTADDAPSKYIARTLSGLYALCAAIGVGMIFKYFTKNENHSFKIGIMFYLLMQIVSGIGYALFPLSNASDIDNQTFMHIVVTAMVVALSVISMIILIIGTIKGRNWVLLSLTVLTFLSMMLGAILTVNIDKAYFGIAERLSVYAVVIYTLCLGIERYIHFSKDVNK